MSVNKRKKHKISRTTLWKGLTVVSALFLMICIGVYVPNLLSEKPSEIVLDQTTPLEEAEDDPSSNPIEVEPIEDSQDQSLEGVEEVLIDTDVLETESVQNGRSEDLGSEEPAQLETGIESQEPAKESTATIVDTQEGEPAESDIEVTVSDIPNVVYTGDSYLDQKINENIDKIDPNDLSNGLAIYRKVDIGYLSSFSEGGVTEEEQMEMSAYLHSVLTDSEIQMGQSIYMKYIGLMN